MLVGGVTGVQLYLAAHGPEPIFQLHNESRPGGIQQSHGGGADIYIPSGRQGYGL
jgi:hypothetical protein